MVAQRQAQRSTGKPTQSSFRSKQGGSLVRSTESAEPHEDLADPQFRHDPHSIFARWRSEGHLRRVRLPVGDEVWLVTGYEEARRALTDPRLSKAPRVSQPNAGQANPLGRHMLATDPPDHTRLRKLVATAFTARRVESLRPRIEEITADLLASMSAHDPVDLIDAFAFPLPMQVLCELLGVPGDERDLFRAWFGDLVAGVEIVGAERLQSSRMALQRFVEDFIEHRRGHLGDDLISGLIVARDSQDRLSEDELISMVFLLLFAGHETTVNLIGNGTYLLLSDRDRWERVRADHALLPGAIEEFLRYESPVEMTSSRIATEDLEVDGQHIAAGDEVMIVLLSANRDPARFESPETVRFDRRTNAHLAFGHGIHYCLGAPLARLEAQIAFSRLLDRFPALRLAVEPEEVTWRGGLLARGLTALPARTGELVAHREQP
jgi:cytochrome P450